MPIPSPGHLPHPGIEPGSLAFFVDLQQSSFSDADLGWLMHFVWSGQPIPSSGDLPDPGIKLGSPALQVDILPAELIHHDQVDLSQGHKDGSMNANQSM